MVMYMFVFCMKDQKVYLEKREKLRRWRWWHATATTNIYVYIYIYWQKSLFRDVVTGGDGGEDERSYSYYCMHVEFSG